MRPPRNKEKLREFRKRLEKLESIKERRREKRRKLSIAIDILKEQNDILARKIIGMEGEEDVLQKEIGKLKGMYCIAKYKDKRFSGGYYLCYCKIGSSMVLRHFYQNLCYPCKISQKHIVIRTFMERLGGVKKDEEM